MNNWITLFARGGWCRTVGKPDPACNGSRDSIEAKANPPIVDWETKERREIVEKFMINQ
jgi:hypothetical protein